MISTSAPIDELLKRLHLANARRLWRSFVERAEKEQWSYERFLEVLVSEEVAQRQGTRLRRVTAQAHFPFLKTVDDFDFTHQSMVRLSLLGSSLSADFVTEGRSLILSGKTGRGKTHLAIAVAYRAIQNGFDARFTTAAALIDDLSRASREGRMRAALTDYTHPDVLICDEVGYLTYGSDAANVLFHVVNERHLKRRSMIFTTNKPLSAWGAVLHDDDLAAAIVDRILERGRLLTLDGPSMRTAHLALDGADDRGSALGSATPRVSARDGAEQRGTGGVAPGETDHLARFSGKPGADFPEPTDQKRRGFLASIEREAQELLDDFLACPDVAGRKTCALNVLVWASPPDGAGAARPG